MVRRSVRCSTPESHGSRMQLEGDTVAERGAPIFSRNSKGRHENMIGER